MRSLLRSLRASEVERQVPVWCSPQRDFHPHSLACATAPRWTLLHVVALFVFPLVGVALAWLLRGRSDPVAWLIRSGAFGCAAAYAALDMISAISAGYATWRLGEGVARPDCAPSSRSVTTG